MPLPLLAIAALVVAVLALGATVAVPYTSNTMTDDDAWQQIINLLNRIRVKKPHNVIFRADPDFSPKCDYWYRCSSDLADSQADAINFYFIKHWHKSNELLIDDGSGLTKANPKDWLGTLRDQYGVATRSAKNANSVPA